MQKKSSSRYLLCISSLIQDFSHFSFESIVRNLLSRIPGEIDIAGHSPDRNQHLAEILRPHCRRFEWTFEPDPELTDVELGMDFRLDSPPNIVRNNVYQWRSMARCKEIKDRLEREEGRYRAVIWTRPDLLFLWPADFPSVIPSKSLFISPHDNWRGYNDRFCIGDSESVGHRMAIYEYFTSSWYPRLVKDPSVFLGPEEKWNPERVLACYLRESGYSILPTFTHFTRFKAKGSEVFGVFPYHPGLHTPFGFDDLTDETAAHLAFPAFLERLEKLCALHLAESSVPYPRPNTKTSGPNPLRRMAKLATLLTLERELLNLKVPEPTQ